jgi:hypothetical protein
MRKTTLVLAALISQRDASGAAAVRPAAADSRAGAPAQLSLGRGSAEHPGRRGVWPAGQRHLRRCRTPLGFESRAQSHLRVRSGRQDCLRAFGGGLFGRRPHALRLDPDGHIWVADGSAHIVVKLNRQGEVLHDLRNQRAGGRLERSGRHAAAEPAQRHRVCGERGFLHRARSSARRGGDPRVLKFRADGAFVKSWGGKGRAPANFRSRTRS